MDLGPSDFSRRMLPDATDARAIPSDASGPAVPKMRFPPLSRRRPGRALPRHSLPPGKRVYAIGDVHGCADELIQLLDMIASDHAARGASSRTIILLGDLLNRGPDSAQVVEHARRLLSSGEGRLIKGNHEELFVRAVRGSRPAIRALLSNGGMATLTSFGLVEEEVNRGNYADLAELLRQRIPQDVVALLDAAEDKIAIGDYLFVHAGLRPGVAIAEQDETDLRWIREEFLNSRVDHGAMVVHGHTIEPGVMQCNNRIGVDTGAYRTGVLSAIGLEGTERWFLATGTG